MDRSIDLAVQRIHFVHCDEAGYDYAQLQVSRSLENLELSSMVAWLAQLIGIFNAI